MGYIISIINNKGGCGKTTTTCNLAEALGRKGKKILVVDMDTQCNTTSKLQPKETILSESLFDILDPKNIEFETKKSIYPTNLRNVQLLPNIYTSGNLEPSLIHGAPKTLFRLKENLRDFSTKNFDYTLIDNPPNMGTFALISLYATDFAIVPIKAGSTDSVTGLLRATKLIGEVSKQGNTDLKLLKVLINNMDRRTSISKAIVAQLKNNFDKNQIFKTIIPISTIFEQAESQGKTIFQTGSGSNGARAFRELAQEVIKTLG